MNRRVMVVLFTLVIGLAAIDRAPGATLAPTDDSFGYQFLHDMPLGSPPFGAYLPAGQTSTGHSNMSVLKFDVASLGLTAADVTSATLSLYVLSTEATGFGVSPSAGSPVTVDLSALGPGAWDEATLTWDSIPAPLAQYNAQVVDATGVTVTFDVTALVQDWLSGAVANNGLLLAGDAPVGSSPNWVIPVFSSKEGSVVPTLSVVPEPAGVALALSALPALFWLGRRRGRLR